MASLSEIFLFFLHHHDIVGQRFWG